MKAAFWLMLGLANLAGQHATAEESAFDRVVAPVLAGRCLDCHSGPKPKGKLDLSRKEQALEQVVAGAPGRSRLWEVVETNEMPPKHPLPESEKAILRDWIAGGATWGRNPIDPFRYSSKVRAGYDWWSLQPLKAPPAPETMGDAWSRNEIDRFVFAKLAEKGLRPSPVADPRSRVRRLYFDLLGLPAPVEVIERFAADPSAGAWARLVDELLESKHYGERWARHWMDVARFGESGGFEYNTPRENAWHYRDWLIRSLNDDLPYDQFVRMQLAGDILSPGTTEGMAAVGFLVAGVHNEVLGNSPKMRMAGRQDGLEEIAGTVGQAFLGMTVHCARCHDHKFDPLSAKEYYQFIAALDGVKHGERTQGRDEESRKLRRRRNELERDLVGRVLARRGDLTTTANLLELRETLEANAEGKTYRVSLRLAPTTWSSASQGTAEYDGVVIRILRGSDGGQLASHFFESREWGDGRNATAFEPKEFAYTGDGSGPVRLRLEPFPLNSLRFGGAIDDLEIREGNRLLFEERFNDLEQTNPPGTQAATKSKVYHSARSSRWQASGVNAIHAVEWAAGNLALQLVGGAPGAVLAAAMPEEKRIEAEIKTIEKQIASSPKRIFTVLSQQPGPMRVLARGDVSLPGETVPAGGLSAVQGLSPDFTLPVNAPDALRRRKLAEWIASPDNPLFHRVAVNRVWHHHFGQGLVLSPSDLGFNGGQPSHPGLLEWLAVRFREDGYSLKTLHRRILTSATWQQASLGENKAAREVDASNRLLWRQNPRRADAETFRDTVLAISGALNPQMFGPGYRDVRVDQVPPTHYYRPIDPIGPEFNRRTLYAWQVRGERSALLETLDCPDPSVTTPVRHTTITPSQTLSQWNHPFILRMADQFAERVGGAAGETTDARVRLAWRLALGRDPDATELSDATALVGRHGLPALARTLFNSSELIWID
jgi:hypothetical protein